MAPPDGFRLKSCRCQCAACLEFFGSVRGFDRHRTGGYASAGRRAHTRRCLTLAEMIAAGWQRDARGVLLTPDARRAGSALGGSIDTGGDTDAAAWSDEDA